MAESTGRKGHLTLLTLKLAALKRDAEFLHKSGVLTDVDMYPFEHVSDAIEDLEVLAGEEDDD